MFIFDDFQTKNFVNINKLLRVCVIYMWSRTLYMFPPVDVMGLTRDLVYLARTPLVRRMNLDPKFLNFPRHHVPSGNPRKVVTLRYYNLQRIGLLCSCDSTCVFRHQCR